MISPNPEIAGPAAAGAPVANPFDWPLAYPAEALLREHIAKFLGKNAFSRSLAKRMQDETGTDFFEWVDHLVLPPAAESALRETGFTEDDVELPPGGRVLHHPRATLPRAIIQADESPAVIALRPEFVADFLAQNNLFSPASSSISSRKAQSQQSRSLSSLFVWPHKSQVSPIKP